MILVVDTSVLVGDLLRVKGRQRLADPRLELFIPEQTLAEVHVELPRRIGAFAASNGLSSVHRDDLVVVTLQSVDNNLAVVATEIYHPFMDEALARSQRDPSDWPVVACALALHGAIWTNDNDFLGTGVPTWTTQTLQTWLDRQ